MFSLLTCRWFVKCDREAAECLLLAQRNHGNVVMRPSKSASQLGNYSITMRCDEPRYDHVTRFAFIFLPRCWLCSMQAGADLTGVHWCSGRDDEALQTTISVRGPGPGSRVRTLTAPLLNFTTCWQYRLLTVRVQRELINKDRKWVNVLRVNIDIRKNNYELKTSLKIKLFPMQCNTNQTREIVQKTE